MIYLIAKCFDIITVVIRHWMYVCPWYYFELQSMPHNGTTNIRKG